MKRKAFVLLSGGIDSTTCLYQAIKDFFPKAKAVDDTYADWLGRRLSAYRRDGDDALHSCNWVEAVSIFYGQRHSRELTYAEMTCKSLGIKHTILDVGKILSGENVLLSAESIGKMDMVHKSYDEIKGVSPSYVPFRNGTLLSVITAHAQKYVNDQIEQQVEEGQDYFDEEDSAEAARRELATLNAKDLCAVYFGAHAEDAAGWAYPDCTPEFIGAMANAIYMGTYSTIRLATPLEWSTKEEIILKGACLGVDYSMTWSCYDNGELHCGKCPTCLARQAGFEAAWLGDPTVYAGGDGDW